MRDFLLKIYSINVCIHAKFFIKNEKISLLLLVGWYPPGPDEILLQIFVNALELYRVPMGELDLSSNLWIGYCGLTQNFKLILSFSVLNKHFR